MGEIVQRLKKYLDYTGVSVSLAEKKIKVSNGTLSKPFNANTAIKTDTLEKFLKVYIDLSPEWVLVGNGEILKRDVKKEAVLLEKPSETIVAENGDEVNLLRDQVKFYKEKADFYEKIYKIETRLHDIEYFNEAIRLKFEIDMEIEKTQEAIMLEEFEKKKLAKKTSLVKAK